METAIGATAVAQLSQFVGAILFFHGSEYALAVFFHGRSNVSLGSLLISKLYVIAMVSALVEYLIEVVLFPGLKEHWWLSNIGLMMVLLGELIRKAAIITARRSFTHNIRVYYDEEHELITHGIYRFMRHPSYCGFFIWATGTQVMLCNPVCIIAFTAVTWRFFSNRIPRIGNETPKLLRLELVSSAVARAEAVVMWCQTLGVAQAPCLVSLQPKLWHELYQSFEDQCINEFLYLEIGHLQLSNLPFLRQEL